MVPQPLLLDSATLSTWISRFWWPVLRISGFIAAAPLVSQGVVPVLIRVGLIVGLAVLLAPLAEVPPNLSIHSGAGLLVAAKEILIGVSIGMVVQVAFESMGLAGQTISQTMGLGFATLIDPQHGASTTVVGQLFTLFALLSYLAMNGHVLLLGALARSFQTLPIGSDAVGPGFLNAVALWGGHVFETGLLIALPAVIALLIVNMALGVVTRAAPQLNLFGIGFPITLLAGFMVLMFGLDALMAGISTIMNGAMAAVGELISAPVARVP
jgi:flagellar biosynthesis protein FliR